EKESRVASACTLRSLPPCGGGLGRGVLQMHLYPRTPTPNPTPQGGGESTAGDWDDTVDDRGPRRPDGGDRLPVRPVRRGRRPDPDRRAAGADAAAVSDGAACHHANGLERLARRVVARAYPLAAGLRLPDRLRAGARPVVADALRAGQADRA